MLDTESAVRRRYSAAADEREAELCCPVDYDTRFLEAIPKEVIERDYGCGDPSKFVNPGETVLDLGSGGGKICFIAAQVVGKEGQVIGVDMNDSMLQLARQSQVEVAQKIGYDNVRFLKGKIQDLALDRDCVESYLKENPVACEADFQRFETYLQHLRTKQPMIPDHSIDVVVSNCVLNLVDSAEKEQLFREIFRVLKVGGRAVISDIVSDEVVPQTMQNDGELWSGCISGAFEERDFLAAFERAGFIGIHMPVRQAEPWQTVQGIEFRSATVIAYKGSNDPCWEHNEAVIYRGPYREVTDDTGHTYKRGERTAVCRKSFEMMTSVPFASDFIGIEPRVAIEPSNAKPFNVDRRDHLRDPKVTKGVGYNLTIAGEDCCSDGGCC